MTATANEATPLVSADSDKLKPASPSRTFAENIKAHVVSPLPPTWETRPDYYSFLYLSIQTIKNHYCSLIACVISALLCAHNDMASKSIFDPLVFKSIFVVFGFTVGFRNMRGNQRRGECLMSVRNICHASWELLLVLPYDEHRPRMREQLLRTLEAIADHVMRVADRHIYKYALSGTEHCDCCERTSGDEEDVRLGPTTLAAAAFMALEDEMSRLQAAQWNDPEFGKSQKYQRTFWAKKMKFDEEHYNLVNYAIPSVSDAYVVLINSSIFIFGMVLPWGLHCNNVNIRGINVMGSGTFLVINTMLVMWVLLGLNTLASQHEDPFVPSYEMIDLRQHMKMFRAAVEHYDAKRIEWMSTHRGEDRVAMHVHITSTALMSQSDAEAPAGADAASAEAPPAAGIAPFSGGETIPRGSAVGAGTESSGADADSPADGPACPPNFHRHSGLNKQSIV